MVGCLQFRTDGVSEVVVVFGVEDVIDAVSGEGISKIGGAESFAAAAEAVFEAVADFVDAVGGRRVVEVTANDDGILAGVNVRPDTLGLPLSLFKSVCDFVVEMLGFGVDLWVAHIIVQHSFACFVIFVTQAHRLEVDVIDSDDFAVVTNVREDGFVVGTVTGIDYAAVDDSVTAENGESELVWTRRVAEKQVVVLLVIRKIHCVQ